MVTAALPTTKHNSTAHEYSFGIVDVATTETAAKTYMVNRSTFRLIRSNRTCANILAGIYNKLNVNKFYDQYFLWTDYMSMPVIRTWDFNAHDNNERDVAIRSSNISRRLAQSVIAKSACCELECTAQKT